MTPYIGVDDSLIKVYNFRHVMDRNVSDYFLCVIWWKVDDLLQESMMFIRICQREIEECVSLEKL
jgi:hypothetical protein